MSGWLASWLRGVAGKHCLSAVQTETHVPSLMKKKEPEFKPACRLHPCVVLIRQLDESMSSPSIFIQTDADLLANNLMTTQESLTSSIAGY